MAFRFLLFFTIASAVWGLAHYYVGRRLLAGNRVGQRTRRRGSWMLGGLFLLVPVVMTLGRAAEGAAWFTPILWLGFLYMGVFVLVFSLIIAVHIAEVATRLLSRLRRGEQAPSDPERRRFLVNAAHAGALGLSGVLSGWGYYEARRLARVEEVDVPIENLPRSLDGYRIVQISDLHVGPTIKGDYVRAVVDVANGLEPDLVAVTGDLVDGTVQHLRRDVAPLSHLRSKDGTYFVTGNHEYYWDAPAWVDELSRLGMRVLNNASELVEREGGRLLVAGCTDYTAGRFLERHRSDPEAVLRSAPESDVKLLLAHQPRSIHAAARAGYDLQLSGHTHGGQFFPVTLFVGLAHPFVRGLGKQGRTHIYVNRGTGYWGPPLRTGMGAEITLLRLRRA